jgi:hypothetical protein
MTQATYEEEKLAVFASVSHALMQQVFSPAYLQVEHDLYFQFPGVENKQHPKWRNRTFLRLCKEQIVPMGNPPPSP